MIVRVSSIILLILCLSCNESPAPSADHARPWTRWWWFAGEIQEDQIDRDLAW
ncbi:MAG: hypothetical protein HRU12_10515, partial [Phaeodactylibacter sp.]|nr:hypothetical protein [Phaeodactylibacter sp.]